MSLAKWTAGKLNNGKEMLMVQNASEAFILLMTRTPKAQYIYSLAKNYQYLKACRKNEKHSY
jgi:hypothetical protein